MTGPNLAQQAAITSQVQQAVRAQTKCCFVTFHAGEASNIKAVLKRINTVALSRDDLDDDEDGDEQITAGRRGTKLLNYDLRILQQAVEELKLERVDIAFQDCEAIDGGLLSDAVELFSCWKDRIPFVLIFGIATSVETLQVNLSKRAVRCIRGRRFDVVDANTTLETLFRHIHQDNATVWLGGNLCRSIVERQKDFLQNAQTIIDSVQYAYMTHFYANALSLFLDPDLGVEDVPQDHFQALRCLPSFMRYVEDLLDDDNNAQAAKKLLESDSQLLHECKTCLKEGNKVMKELLAAGHLWTSLSALLKGLEEIPNSELVMLAVSGGLAESSKMANFLLHLKRANTEVLQQLLEFLVDITTDKVQGQFKDQQTDLMTLLQDQTDTKGPLRSEEDIRNSPRRTPVVAKKIELSRARTTLTKADEAYSEILNRFIEPLQSYLSERLIAPKSLPFNEIFLFDLLSPHRTVFTPRPRQAIERALSQPHDYLNCTCCNPDQGEEASLSATQPATAVLYQFYLKSGQLINASDLRSAVATLLADKIPDEQVLAAAFQRSLAELSHLGFLKPTKKRSDHVMKQAWRGL